MEMQEVGDINLDLDSTVPTDLTVSSFSDDGTRRRKSKNMLEDYFRERKDLRKQVQLLSIETARKNAVISSLQGELSMKTEEYRDKLKSVLHEKQLIQTKLQTQLRLTEEENSLKTTILKRELNSLKEKNEELENILEAVKNSAENLTLSDSDSRHLRIQPSVNLSFADYITMKINELVRDLRKENENLKSTVMKFRSQISDLQTKLAVCQDELQKERNESLQLKEKCSSLLTKLNLVQGHVEHRNFAQENFSRVKLERDRLQNEILDLKKQTESTKLQLLEAQQDKENSREELIRLKQDQAVLRKECENVSGQLSDAIQKWGEFQDKAARLQSELNVERLSREELYHQFANSKDKLRESFEERLEQERNKVKNEMMQLHEKEIRSLAETRASALRQKDTFEAAMVELRIKYEQLYAKFHETSAHDTVEVKTLKRELGEAKAELLKRSSALDQLKSSHEEKLSEGNKAIVKLHIVEQELDTLKKSSENKVQQLENELAESKARLAIYEDLEKELNEVISEAAQMDESESHAIVEEVSGGMQMPPNTRFSFMRCISLTKKVMQLERTVLALQNQLDSERERKQKACEELTRANELLQQVQQPYGYLISKVKENESYIEELKSMIVELKKRVDSANKEKDRVIAERDQLAVDLQESFANREELIKIKQELALMQKSAGSEPTTTVTTGTKKFPASKKRITARKK